MLQDLQELRDEMVDSGANGSEDGLAAPAQARVAFIIVGCRTPSTTCGRRRRCPAVTSCYTLARTMREQAERLNLGPDEVRAWSRTRLAP